MGSKAILILGESGVGKTSSVRNLDPKKTFIFSVLGKGIPVKNSKSNYTLWNKDNNPTGNYVVTSSSKVVVQWLQHISKNMPHITSVIIDDAVFLSAKELDRRREEVGYQKFNDIAHDFLALTETANTLRDDLHVYFLYHVSVEGDGILENKVTKALSHGKMIQEKLASVEAQFEIVFLACKVNNDDVIEYKFKTRDMNSTAKTPMGMFSEDYIDNDLNYINDVINCYYDGDCADEPKVEAKKVKEKV